MIRNFGTACHATRDATVTPVKRALLRSVLALALAVLPIVPALAANLVCESRDRRDNYCPANTRGGVVLARQRSSAACIKGETWGYDRRGIWVTGGCSGEFQIGVGSYAEPGAPNAPARDGERRIYGYDRTPDAARGYGSNGARSYSSTLVCESRDYRYQRCNVPVRNGVELIEQRSNTPCRFNRSWGYDRNGIWVDQGCAAEFAIH